MSLKSISYHLFSFILGLSMLASCSQDSPKVNAESEEQVFTQDSLSTDFTSAAFTSGIEGPVVDENGNLYVVNFGRQGTIGVVSMDGDASEYVELPSGSIGNGLRFSKDYQTLFVADYVNHQVLAINMQNKEVSVFAESVEGLNQPNDIAIMSSGILFASDPNWGNSTGNLWRVSADGEFILLEDDMGTTNGVEVSPAEDLLYVNESVQRRIWVYDLSSDGSVSNKRLFIEFSDFGLDGMRCDRDGNLYVARYGAGTIAVINPSGDLMFEVDLEGINPTNIAFGGSDGRTCYVTIQDRKLVEFFRNSIPGRSFFIK